MYLQLSLDLSKNGQASSFFLQSEQYQGHTSNYLAYKRYRQQKGPSRMDSPVKLATLGTLDTGREQINTTNKNTTQHRQTYENTRTPPPPPKKNPVGKPRCSGMACLILLHIFNECNRQLLVCVIHDLLQNETIIIALYYEINHQLSLASLSI